MAYANLVEQKEILTGQDGVVIVEYFEGIRGGRTLDVTGYTPTIIRAGHVIIVDSDGEYKPMPIVGTQAIISLGTITAGSGYVDDTYEDIALTGGNGTGAKATIVVEDNKVVSVTITEPGAGYEVGDSLTTANTNLGGQGSGFAVVVTEVDTTLTKYGSLPAGCQYAGVLRATIETKKPFAAIMVRGTVNPLASPYDVTPILTAFKTAVPHIIWRAD
jgi:hypothetical protein